MTGELELILKNLISRVARLEEQFFDVQVKAQFSWEHVKDLERKSNVAKINTGDIKEIDSI